MNDTKVVRYECTRCGDKFMNEADDATYVTHADYRALEEHRASVEFLLKLEREAHEATKEELAALRGKAGELVEADLEFDRNEDGEVKTRDEYEHGIIRRRLALEALK